MNFLLTCLLSGWRVLQAIIEALLDAGMMSASDIIMSGGSGENIDYEENKLAVANCIFE